MKELSAVTRSKESSEPRDLVQSGLGVGIARCAIVARFKPGRARCASQDPYEVGAPGTCESVPSSRVGMVAPVIGPVVGIRPAASPAEKQ